MNFEKKKLGRSFRVRVREQPRQAQSPQKGHLRFLDIRLGHSSKCSRLGKGEEDLRPPGAIRCEGCLKKGRKGRRQTGQSRMQFQLG